MFPVRKWGKRWNHWRHLRTCAVGFGCDALQQTDEEETYTWMWQTSPAQTFSSLCSFCGQWTWHRNSCRKKCLSFGLVILILLSTGNTLQFSYDALCLGAFVFDVCALWTGADGVLGLLCHFGIKENCASSVSAICPRCGIPRDLLSSQTSSCCDTPVGNEGPWFFHTASEAHNQTEERNNPIANSFKLCEGFGSVVCNFAKSPDYRQKEKAFSSTLNPLL